MAGARRARRARVAVGGRVAAGLVLGALTVTGCGTLPRQDRSEPSRSFKVAIPEASFPTKQKLAKRSTMTIAVKNLEKQPLPNVAVTVTGFDRRGADRETPLADPYHPVFSLNRMPRNGDTALVDTYALGPLEPGQTKTFVFDATAVRPGPFDLKWRVAAGLFGKAKAVLADGRPPHGEFRGTVADAPPSARVDLGDSKTILRDRQPIGPQSR